MNHWTTKHTEYKVADWITKPSIFAQEAIKFFPKKGKLLELGAGQGQDSRFFAKNGYDVISTDNSSEALKLNRNEANKNNIIMKIEELDLSKPFHFENNSFDVVYSHLALHYFDKKMTLSIFDEIYRVLKNEGILALLVNSVNDPDYGIGEEIENDYFLFHDIKKRYFSKGSLVQFVTMFETIILDEKGETYKDNAKGVHNLVRFVGRKTGSKTSFEIT